MLAKLTTMKELIFNLVKGRKKMKLTMAFDPICDGIKINLSATEIGDIQVIKKLFQSHKIAIWHISPAAYGTKVWITLVRQSYNPRFLGALSRLIDEYNEAEG